jgi:hypothetical protein
MRFILILTPLLVSFWAWGSTFGQDEGKTLTPEEIESHLRGFELENPDDPGRNPEI